MNKLLFALLLAGTLLLQSCGDNKKESDRVENAEESNGMKEGREPGLPDDAAKFAVKATNDGMLAVQLSQLALKKNLTPALREYADTMIKDHEKANTALKELAAKKNITLPTTLSIDNQETYERMDQLSGPDFNAQYAKTMLNSQKKTVKLFEKAAKDVNDADLREFAVKTLPTLKLHLKDIEDIEAVR
ncbi:MAG: DUF4142 domain-containing protein [Spirosoma sp.]|nr:DUF4142 domain-containing protein [Spirosoma sp.]